MIPVSGYIYLQIITQHRDEIPQSVRKRLILAGFPGICRYNNSVFLLSPDKHTTFDDKLSIIITSF